MINQKDTNCGTRLWCWVLQQTPQKLHSPEDKDVKQIKPEVKN